MEVERLPHADDVRAVERRVSVLAVRGGDNFHGVPALPQGDGQVVDVLGNTPDCRVVALRNNAYFHGEFTQNANVSTANTVPPTFAGCEAYVDAAAVRCAPGAKRLPQNCTAG